MTTAQSENLVLVLPGLRGPNSDFGKESFTTQQLRDDLNGDADVVELSYQSRSKLLNNFGHLGLEISNQIDKQIIGRKNVVIYASSVGGSVLIQALPFLASSNLHVVMNGPVINPMDKVAQLVAQQQAKHLKDIALIKSPDAHFDMSLDEPFKLLERVLMQKRDGRGKRYKIPVPVSYNAMTEQNPGFVNFDSSHFTDAEAYRLVVSPASMFPDMSPHAVGVLTKTGYSADKWVSDIEQNDAYMASLMMMAGSKDGYCLPHEIDAFIAAAQQITAAPINRITWDSGHNDTGPQKQNDILNAVRAPLGLPLHPSSVPAAVPVAKNEI